MRIAAAEIAVDRLGATVDIVADLTLTVGAGDCGKLATDTEWFIAGRLSTYTALAY